MDFKTIALTRQSCREYDPSREVEDEKIQAILEMARLAPSACNGQPYHITVCRGDAAMQVAATVTGKGMNQFAKDAPVMIVISEKPYLPITAKAAKIKGIEFRLIDIGLLASYITAEATVQGLDTCILGWLDDEKIREICGLDTPVRLVISMGYAPEGYPLREKIRKPLSELTKTIE